MAVDQSLLDAIKGFEGYAPTAQWDYKQYSSGYGTRAQPGDENIPPDQLKAVYEQRLQDEVAKAAAHVDSVNPNLPAGARNALISLTYNAGPGWSQAGLGDLVRAGDMEGAQARLLEYNKAGGKVNDGLVSRRQKEASWFGGAPVGQPTPSPSGLPIPQAPVPTFAAQQTAQAVSIPQQPAEQPQQTGRGYFAQMPAEQMAAPPPILMPPRRAVDLTKLKAALASGNRGFFFGGKA